MVLLLSVVGPIYIEISIHTENFFLFFQEYGSLTYFFDSIMFVLSPPGQKMTLKPGPSGTLNVESWSS
jgi:hypothetical protein